MKIAFNFTGPSETVTVLEGTNSYNKTKDVGRDTYYVLVDDTTAVTAGTVNLVATAVVDGVTYKSSTPITLTPNVYPFIVHPDLDYTLETSADFAGVAVGFLSDGSTWGADIGVA